MWASRRAPGKTRMGEWDMGWNVSAEVIAFIIVLIISVYLAPKPCGAVAEELGVPLCLQYAGRHRHETWLSSRF